jgi:hypothetical protein
VDVDLSVAHGVNDRGAVLGGDGACVTTKLVRDVTPECVVVHSRSPGGDDLEPVGQLTGGVQRGQARKYVAPCQVAGGSE